MDPNSDKTIYLELPTSQSENQKYAIILSDLGKATKRGIRKCYKCGMYNGSRGIACKNKHCDAIFKECDKRNINLGAVKLITGICRQLYSVRVRDRGPDFRGFVQLPQIHSNSEENLLSDVALCFVDSCQRLFDDSILKCHEKEPNSATILCVHIDSALKSKNIATPVQFKRDVFNIVKIPNEIREKLWVLASENEEPLVQRISRTVFAIKCQVTPKHPLGYLHFMFYNKGKESYDRYYCSCTEFMGPGKDKSCSIRLKCLHYYACICALSSDSRFSEEFKHFINFEFPRKNTILGNYPNTNNFGKNIDVFTFRKKINYLKRQPTEIKIQSKSMLQKRRCVKLAPKVLPVQIKILSNQHNLKSLNLENGAWQFFDWLSFVTESINQTMRFENCGILNTLLFDIPQHFYDDFKKRIPTIYIENENNIPPLSRIFCIMQIQHLKLIFDTPKIKLRISKKFIHDCQKGYVEYNEEQENENYQSNFIFFLNVGQSTVDESDNTNNSFIIEWIPNITNITKIGQLKLQYKYGRKAI